MNVQNKEQAHTEEKNYRDIADIMTRKGFKMNHSSVRNYVNRVMYKFIKGYVTRHGVPHTKISLDKIARSSTFQRVIADILHMISLDTYTKKEGDNDERRIEKPTKDNA